MLPEDKKVLQDCLARCALGDQVAFKRLYGVSSKKLLGVAYRMLKNIDSANEVLQEAFVQIWRNSTEYRPDLAEPMTWMSSIVRYRALDRIKMEGRRIEGNQLRMDIEDFDETSSSHNDHSSRIELNEQLTICLDSLDASQKKSIMMAYCYGFSRIEISEYFDTSVNTVKSWLRRGSARLQQCLAR